MSIRGGEGFVFLSFSFLPFLSFLPFSSPFIPPSFSLEVGPHRILLGGLAERCELPQRGLGRSLIRNRILCILALKDEIWRQQFLLFPRKYADQIGNFSAV